MNATREEVLIHAKSYHGFLVGLRWVLCWGAASLATVILILARAGVVGAFVGGSVVFAIFAFATKYVFLNPHEHEVEDMADRVGR